MMKEKEIKNELREAISQQIRALDRNDRAEFVFITGYLVAMIVVLEDLKTKGVKK